ncbi:hypothetical protein [Nitrosomonas sp. Nm34]|uniref:hypothetical protein n=1 Tax=Nitrosomonas sp. Nm34 TaxID=1881055 RepID=UPI0008E0D06A|nr:hypothetical protein [Nitrosomonas sp. Nm34]SFI34043.1 hypothetical protein SAMN05428978_100638 [Nitrosomonas sp. Nm34]
MKLVQFLLPLNDNLGKKFPKKLFKDIKEELTKKFSGITAFSQSPAEGVWEDEGYVQKDQIIIYEVMAVEFDQNWCVILPTSLRQNSNKKRLCFAGLMFQRFKQPTPAYIWRKMRNTSSFNPGSSVPGSSNGSCHLF